MTGTKAIPPLFLFEVAEPSHLCGDLEIYQALDDLAAAIDAHFIEDVPELFIAFDREGQRVGSSISLLGVTRADMTGLNDADLLQRMLLAQFDHMKIDFTGTPYEGARSLEQLVDAAEWACPVGAP